MNSEACNFPPSRHVVPARIFTEKRKRKTNPYRISVTEIEIKAIEAFAKCVESGSTPYAFSMHVIVILLKKIKKNCSLVSDSAVKYYELDNDYLNTTVNDILS